MYVGEEMCLSEGREEEREGGVGEGGGTKGEREREREREGERAKGGMVGGKEDEEESNDYILFPLIPPAVGKAFGDDVAPHPDILQFLFGDDEKENATSPWRKMAIVPKSTKVYLRPNDYGKISYVLMVVRNVHCYPGVPSLFQQIFQKCKVICKFTFASPTYVHVHVHVCSTCQRFINEQSLSHHKSLAPMQYNYHISLIISIQHV